MPLADQPATWIRERAELGAFYASVEQLLQPPWSRLGVAWAIGLAV